MVGPLKRSLLNAGLIATLVWPGYSLAQQLAPAPEAPTGRTARTEIGRAHV